MYEPIHEKIKVLVEFNNHRLKIINFEWQGREHVVEQINLVTKARKGRELVWVYYVSNEAAAYKLRYDTESITWWLEEITWDQEKDQS